MDKIFASKFGLSEIIRVHDVSFRCIDGDPLSESSKELTSFYDAVNPIDDNHPQRLMILTPLTLSRTLTSKTLC